MNDIDRLAAEAEERVERELAEAKLREILRKKNEGFYARSMLATFVKHFGHKPEFARVVYEIDAVLQRRSA